jgi:uncharacterized protein (TIGR03067 family)
VAVSLESDGEKAPDRVVKRTRLTVQGDKIVPPEEEGGPAFTFRLDPSATPKRINLTEGGRTLRGIYKVEDSRLHLCVRFEDDGKYPTEFTGNKAHTYLVLRRDPNPPPPRPPEEAKVIAAINKLGGVVEIDEEAPGRPVVRVRLGT